VHLVVISGSSKCHSIVGHVIDALVPGLPLDLEIKRFTVHPIYAAGRQPKA
jgi:hypothetical protein